MFTIKGNLWNYLLDRECLRNDCGTEDEYIIVWDGQHRVPRLYSSSGNYEAGEGIKIDGNKISVDQAQFPTTESVNEIVDSKIAELDVSDLKRRVTAMEESNPEEVRFLLVQMDGDRETTINNARIDAETDAVPTWISGSPNGIIELYVGDGYITIVSSEDESGIVRLRLSKAKPNAFLNHL